MNDIAGSILVRVFVPLMMYFLIVKVVLSKRYYETLVFCDYSREIGRRIIDVALGRLRTIEPRLRFDSEKQNGVVLRVRVSWWPWWPWLGWERIAITAEERTLRVVSKGAFLLQSSLWWPDRGPIELVREELIHALDWARNHSHEEIVQEGLRQAFPELAEPYAPADGGGR